MRLRELVKGSSQDTCSALCTAWLQLDNRMGTRPCDIAHRITRSQFQRRCSGVLDTLNETRPQCTGSPEAG